MILKTNEEYEETLNLKNNELEKNKNENDAKRKISSMKTNESPKKKLIKKTLNSKDSTHPQNQSPKSTKTPTNP